MYASGQKQKDFQAAIQKKIGDSTLDDGNKNMFSGYENN